jgi:hypothetical protein
MLVKAPGDVKLPSQDCGFPDINATVLISPSIRISVNPGVHSALIGPPFLAIIPKGRKKSLRSDSGGDGLLNSLSYPKFWPR